MEIASEVIHILKTLRDIRKHMLRNQVDVGRLCDRCLALQPPIEALTTNADMVQQKWIALENLRSVLHSSMNFINKFNERTAWRLFTKVAFRLDYGFELSQLNVRLNQCVVDLSLGITIDNELRRAEDLMDMKKSFENAVARSLSEIANDKNSAASEIDILRTDIAENQQVIVKMLQQRNYRALNVEEERDLQNLNSNLMNFAVQKLDEISNAVRAIEVGQDQILHLIQDMKMSKESHAKRQQLLSKLVISFGDIDKGNDLTCIEYSVITPLLRR